MPTIDTLHELLKHELKDLYSAEVQIIDALPDMADAASAPSLKKALREHLAVTKKQKQRLEKVQDILGTENAVPERKGFFANLFNSNEGEEHCKAMEGLIKEGNALLDEDMTPEVMDAAIIAAAQKIEHYEISSYGTAHAYALQLNLSKVADLLEETKKEEYAADDSLTQLAVSKVNLDAEPRLESSIEPKEAPVAKAADKTVKKASSKKAKSSNTAKKSSPKPKAKKQAKKK